MERRRKFDASCRLFPPRRPSDIAQQLKPPILGSPRLSTQTLAAEPVANVTHSPDVRRNSERSRPHGKGHRLRETSITATQDPSSEEKEAVHGG